ncbi:GntR family transcriptional regulator [Acuticoccus mangrovi]|uniref:GntR family transcriptional regulator n=1 Tax=Acuticoccus mangrovi TaxID=2796142 RepID=A0A934MJ84_9HYPH|nr:GntR family transcriptional regulator [Acuticoccus mangrovi]MBJ3778645.1 GntR family transcriptional regulator [Acuticoccus mangrovi]
MTPLDQSPILVDRTYDELVMAIAACRLKPGERIRQADLAERLGVSRQPVSHALQLLKRQGLVEDVGRKGLAVARIDPLSLTALYQVRAALDALAARLAAERMRDGALTGTDRARLADCIAKGRSLGEDAGIERLVAADVAFHRLLNGLSGNAWIADTLEPQFPHMMRSMMVVLDDPGFRTRAWREHAAIAEMILAGRPAEAADAARIHAEAAGEETGRRLTTLSG